MNLSDVYFQQTFRGDCRNHRLFIELRDLRVRNSYWDGTLESPDDVSQLIQLRHGQDNLSVLVELMSEEVFSHRVNDNNYRQIFKKRIHLSMNSFNYRCDENAFSHQKQDGSELDIEHLSGEILQEPLQLVSSNFSKS